eukprot:scaffold45646_cov21-Tisochrysis_lutea.AAC.1
MGHARVTSRGVRESIASNGPAQMVGQAINQQWPPSPSLHSSTSSSDLSRKHENKILVSGSPLSRTSHFTPYVTRNPHARSARPRHTGATGRECRSRRLRGDASMKQCPPSPWSAYETLTTRIRTQSRTLYGLK